MFFKKNNFDFHKKTINDLTFYILYVGILENYVFIVEYAQGYVFVVDPAEDKILPEFLKNYKFNVTDVLLTHNDLDHVGGVEVLKNKYDCRVYGNKNDIKLNGLVTNAFEAGHDIEFNGLKFKTQLVEGHINHMVSYYDFENNYIFPGDGLFKLGCGRMFDGDEYKYFKTMEYFKSLNDDCVVFFPHEYTLKNFEFTKSAIANIKNIYGMYEKIFIMEEVEKQNIEIGKFSTPTTIGFEKKYNLFMLAKDEAEFKELRDYRNKF